MDSNKNKHGLVFDGVRILGDVTYLKDKEYDKVIIGALSIDDIKQFLITHGVPEDKIVSEYVRTYTEAREFFVKEYSDLLREYCDADYCVAEGGVYKGYFSKIINESFPDKTLYLFDTFEGFNAKDIEIEKSKQYSQAEIYTHFKETNEKMVLDRLPYKENVVVCKGFFPGTTKDIPDKKFGFVNLDFDLYAPTLEGLRYFYPRMVDGGVILIHDYYSSSFNGIKQAVLDYMSEESTQLNVRPIGDHMSIAVYKGNLHMLKKMGV